jgi:hypothetical protein
LQVVWLCRYHHALAHGTQAWTRQLELFEPMPQADGAETGQDEVPTSEGHGSLS